MAPTYRRLVQTALEMLDRDASAERVDAVLARLREADASEVESSAIDTDAALHAAKRSRGGGATWHLSRDYPN